MIGKGTITKKDGSVLYSGTVPDAREGEPVVLMRLSDLELMVNHDLMALLASQLRMKPEIIRTLPDEMEYTANDGTKHRLFLDHQFYTRHPKDYMFIRYTSVDESFMEETP